MTGATVVRRRLPSHTLASARIASVSVDLSKRWKSSRLSLLPQSAGEREGKNVCWAGMRARIRYPGLTKPRGHQPVTSRVPGAARQWSVTKQTAYTDPLAAAVAPACCSARTAAPRCCRLLLSRPACSAPANTPGKLLHNTLPRRGSMQALVRPRAWNRAPAALTLLELFGLGLAPTPATRLE